MSDPRAFISFDYDHNATERMLFVGQIRNSRTPFAVQDWSSKSVLPQSQWERLISTKIAATNMMIVLVGENTFAARGVLKEIVFAINKEVPTFGVYVGSAGTHTFLPMGLTRNRVIAWEWSAIAGAVTQMMKEGKNTRAS